MRVPLALALIGSAIIAACSSGPRWKGRDPVFSKLPVSRNPRYAKANLIEISQVDSSISIDLRYTRGSTILKIPLYEMGMPALLRPETAVRLRRANEVVKKHGYRIQIWDAYRPPSAQLKLWYASGEDVRFVADPFSKPSQHSCGTAVDVTLVTSSGKAVEMPTGFDVFSPKAAARYEHPDPEVMKRKLLLQRAMYEAGFFPLPNEWWHFTDKNFKKYPDTIALKDIRP
jgi:D-alanyl-D-alanine dipeptidase